MEIATFEVVLETHGDELTEKEVSKWARQIKEKLDKEWYVRSVEYLGGERV